MIVVLMKANMSDVINEGLQGFAVLSELFAMPNYSFAVPNRSFAMPNRSFAMPNRSFAMPKNWLVRNFSRMMRWKWWFLTTFYCY